MTQYEEFKKDLHKLGLENDPTIHCISVKEGTEMGFTHEDMVPLVDNWLGFQRGEDKYFLFHALCSTPC